MPLQHLIEFLDGAVVIQIIEMVEGRPVQRVVGAERQSVPGASYLRIRLSDSRLGQNQRHGDKQIGQAAGKQMDIPYFGLVS
jgi:hypothetical protein